MNSKGVESLRALSSHDWLLKGSERFLLGFPGVCHCSLCCFFSTIVIDFVLQQHALIRVSIASTPYFRILLVDTPLFGEVLYCLSLSFSIPAISGFLDTVLALYVST